jgi:hypothetical protein
MKTRSRSGLSFLLLPLACVAFVYHPSAARGQSSPNGPAVEELNDKVAKLNLDTATLVDVIRLLGPPLSYGAGRKTFDKDNLPPVYFLKYPHHLSIEMRQGRVSSVRFMVPGFFYRSRLQVGSSLDDVFDVVGRPAKTVVGAKFPAEDKVFYQDMAGRGGIGCYRRSEAGVIFFINDSKIAAIHLTPLARAAGGGSFRTLLSPRGSLSVVRQPPAATFRKAKLPSYDPTSSDAFQIDLRGGDVSHEDLRGRLADLAQASFDDRTIWPDQLPEGFNPQQTMTLGRNPGLRVRELHQAGIAGKGVGIGIIDTALLVDHVEYRDRLRLYEEIHCSDKAASMHGAAVASIAVGKTVGVAPEADLYFIAETHGSAAPGAPVVWDFSWLAKSIDRLLEINRTVPVNRKIRAISISSAWSPDRTGYEAADRAVERARRDGVFVISTALYRTHKLAFHGLGRAPLLDPDKVRSYGPGTWWRRAYFSDERTWGHDRWPDAEVMPLLVPMDSRCVASPTGRDQYVFYAQGGWSWCVPYLAGLYALACQVEPTVTPEEFWSVALKTGRTVPVEQDGRARQLGKIVDPVALIHTLKD